MVLNALKSFPNLEMLPLTYSLSDQGPNLPREGLAVQDLTKMVRLPRLRHLELKDLLVFAHISLTLVLVGAAFNIPTISHLTRELRVVAAVAPAWRAAFTGIGPVAR